MAMNRNRLVTLSMAVLMTAGSACLAQQADPPPVPIPPPPHGQAQPLVTPPTPGREGERAEADRQVRQQLDRIQQQKDNLTGDRLCVLHLAIGGQFEVAYAQQAQQKSQDATVKKIAQRLIDDHQQANQRLTAVAEKLQVELPTGLPSVKQKELDILGSLDSKDYDQTFLAKNDAMHAADVTALRHESRLAKSSELKEFAVQTLPTLREHWQMIRQSETAMGWSDADAQPAGARIQGVTPQDNPPDAAQKDRPNPITPPQPGPNRSGNK